MEYHTPDKALASAMGMMKKANVESVKIEGGVEIQQAMKNIITAGIHVMGYLGPTPEHIHHFANYGARTRTKRDVKI